MLVRTYPAETDIDSDSFLSAAESINVSEQDDAVEVRVTICHQHGAAVFCGLEDGSVAVYEVDSGKQVQLLYKHVLTPVSCLAWGIKGSIIVSADASGRVMMWRINPNRDRWDYLSLLDIRVDGYVYQLLLDPESTRLLVSTEKSVTIWSTDGKVMGSISSPSKSVRHWWHWTQHPRIAQQLILVNTTHTFLYDWKELKPSHFLAVRNTDEQRRHGRYERQVCN